MRILSIDPGKVNFASCIVSDSVTEDPILESFDLGAMDCANAMVFKAGCDAVFDGLEYDAVICEKQVPKNPGMRRASAWLEMYFAVRGKRMVGVAARLKNASLFADPERFDTGTYRGRKKASVTLATELLAGQPMNDKYLALKKKDDVADAFLQAVYYIKFTSSKTTIPRPLS